MYARSNCSVSPATTEIAGPFNGIPAAFMESSLEPVEQERETMIEPLVKAKHRVVWRPASQLAQAKQLESAIRAWRSDPRRWVFAAPTVPLSVPLRDRSECGQLSYFCRSKRTCSMLSLRLHA